MSYSLLSKSRTATLVNEEKGHNILARSSSESFYKAASEETNTLLFSNSRFAKFIVIPKLKTKKQIQYFVDEHFFKGLELNLPKKIPGAIISVMGGASYYEIDSKLDQVVRRGFIKAAQNLGAWIIDGGMHTGVMKYVGNSIHSMAAKDVPLIGVAPLHKVNHWEELKKMQTYSYNLSDVPDGQDVCNLDPNHSHFILVDSDVNHWGQETEFMNKLRAHLKEERNIPVIVIALNGGGVTLEVIAHGLEHGFPTIIVVGTGRICDALAALVRTANKYKTIPASTTCELLESVATEEDLELWIKFVTNEADSHEGLLETMNKVLKFYKHIMLFDPSEPEHEGLDCLILEGFLATKDNLAEKIETCIYWGDDAELVQELISKEGSNVKAANTHEKNLFLTLVKNRPNIFNVLCDNHAYFTFPLRLLYENNSEIKLQLNRGHKRLLNKITSWPDYIRDKIFVKQVNHRTKSTCADFEEVMDIIADIGPVSTEYTSLCSKFFDSCPPEIDRMARLSFIDLLMWAVFINRMELAKVIWKRTKFPAHSALLACNLYRNLAIRAIRTQEYLDNAQWFEKQALRLLNSLDYGTALEMIKFTSPTMLGNYNLEDTAAEGECKAVMAHPHMQQHLDELLYSYSGHGIRSSLSNAHLILNIVTYFPKFLFYLCKPKKGSPIANSLCDKQHEVDTAGKGLIAANVQTFFDQQLRAHSLATRHPLKQKKEDTFLKKNPLVYFSIPIVKFWTSMLFYVGFLFLQAYTLLSLQSAQISIPEYILWAWIFCMATEEILEITSKEGSGYFSHFTNKMDMTLIVLHLVYIGLRIAHHFTEKPELMSGAVNSLLVACIISWLRLMAIFPVSSTFGPLFFILLKLFTHDFVLWAVVFTLFAVSFQIGFMSLAIQAGMNPTEAYPHESGIFPVSYVTIIGEWSYLMEIMDKTPTGVVFLAIYAFIVQVMLVNLLIAMMGDTYSSVRENSDVEWKYFRYSFVQDNMAASPLPPPLNIVYFFVWIFCAMKNACSQKAALVVDKIMEEEHHKKEQMLCEQAIAKVMRVTVDKLAQDTEREESQSPLVQIQLTKQGVSRITHELQKRELENYIHKLHLSTREQIYKIGARQDEQDKRAEEKVNLPNVEKKLKELAEKMEVLETKLNEKEKHLESMLTQLTQQVALLIKLQKE